MSVYSLTSTPGNADDNDHLKCFELTASDWRGRRYSFVGCGCGTLIANRRYDVSINFQESFVYKDPEMSVYSLTSTPGNADDNDHLKCFELTASDWRGRRYSFVGCGCGTLIANRRYDVSINFQELLMVKNFVPTRAIEQYDIDLDYTVTCINEPLWITTLISHTSCKLSDQEFLNKYYRASNDEYFFERDPSVFEAVLNYLRTTELHLPPNVCISATKKELEFWGIAAEQTERCCWTRFNTLLNLSATLGLNRKSCDCSDDVNGYQTWWKRYRPIVWSVLNQSQSSFASRVFGILSFILALMSLFSFIAATSEPFKMAARTNSQINSGSINNAEHSTTPINNTESGKEEQVNDAVLNFMGKHVVLNVIDIICLIYFTLEYFIRLIFAPNRLRYVRSLLAIIDLLAVLPDYLDIVIMITNPRMQAKIADFSYGMVIRVLRTLKIFRLVRHNTGLWVLIHTIKASIRELSLLVWFLGLGVIVFSTLIYFAENRELFGSIPECFWWALITMTTVGYGDYYPITFLGKVIGSLCAMCGVLLIGFTVPTLVNNFIMFYGQMKALKHFERKLDKPSDILSDL